MPRPPSAISAPFVEEARDVALNAAQDAIRSTVAGRMSIDEWAGIAIEGVDGVKERAVDEGQLRFVGGKLKFSMPAAASEAPLLWKPRRQPPDLLPSPEYQRESRSHQRLWCKQPLPTLGSLCSCNNI